MQKGILIVPFMTGYGGTETVIKNLFRSHQKRPNYELKVYSIGGSVDYEWAKNINIDIKWISKNRKVRDLYSATVMPFNIFNYLWHEKPDFVISTNPIIWYLAKLSLRLMHRNTPVIGWYHYSIDQKPIRKIFLNAADYYLSISSGIKKQLMNKGIPSSKIFLIYNPVVTDEHIIERPKKTHFIYIGRVMLDGQKNLRELIDGLSLVKGNWILDIYGDVSHSNDVKKYAKSKKIAQNIVWHGFINNPWQEDDIEATALLLTSKYEGLPMVLCEGISHGVYCISADTSTGPEDIINNQNGKLYSLGNINELARILQKIVDNQVLPDQKEIQLTAQIFSPDQYKKRFDNAIKTILKK